MASSTGHLLLMSVAILGAAGWCFASDTITATSAISGNRTVVSRAGNFELGFFRPAGDSSNHRYYVGIWYKKAVTSCTPVWVANRAAPVSDPASSKLAVAADGNLVLTNEAGELVWSSNVVFISGSRSIPSNNGTVSAVILDSGNLVLRRDADGGDGEVVVLWQSAEHPTDTWLPGVRLGMDKITGDVQALTSWTSSGDPAPGMYSLGIDPNGTSQFFSYWNATVTFWSSGEWNGNIFAGIPEMTAHYFYSFEFVSDASASYFEYTLQDPTVISRFVLDVSGQARQLVWVPSAGDGEWMIVWAVPHLLCDVYAVCGAFGVCDEKSQPFCSCPEGFRPSSVEDWELGDHSHGCRRNHSLQCDGDDAFLPVLGISLPAPGNMSSPQSPVEVSSDQDCRLACLRRCDCNAYSYGCGRCALWYGDLLNLQRQVEVDDTAGNGTGDGELYLRVSAMDVSSKGRNRNRTAVFVSTAAVASILVLSAIAFVSVKMFRKRQSSMRSMQAAAAAGGGLVAFRYSDLRRATKNFSEKLGGGGFGSVYRGTLPGAGGEPAAIAVKRLEGGVLCVGEKQFSNEVRTIGRIQHVNLVRLRGFCSDGGERLLAYDHMPNGSLDRALFSPAAPPLSWSARFQIAVGAARGLLYLHEGCRDCIIHCDVKPENILLDADLVPKVADFGMAKLVGREFSRVLTTVRGTIGYLAPEWISGVPVTAKADVYSYGMVLLEIISGRRNARCQATTATAEQGAAALSEYFPLVAARTVGEGSAAALVALLDERLRGEADPRELERACRVACWCVQDDEAHRPTMEQVVQALEGVVTLDVPPIPTSLDAFIAD